MCKNEHHYVLVHGDCQGAWCWYKVATLLRSNGHKVTALDMAGCGMDPKQIEDVCTITDYSKPLMLFMELLPSDERVILVAHSRGGVDISIAMERFPKKVAVSVFVTAAMHGPHLDLPTVSKQFEQSLDPPLDNKYTYGQEQSDFPISYLFGPKFLESTVYQLSPAEDLTLATFLIRPSPLYVDFHRSSTRTALTKENYGSVPRVYIVCDQDKLMKQDVQWWLIANNPPDEVKLIKGSDHMAMLSKPQELCSCLLEVGNKYWD